MIETQQSVADRTNICDSCPQKQSLGTASYWQCNAMGGVIQGTSYTYPFSCPEGKWTTQFEQAQS